MESNEFNFWMNGLILIGLVCMWSVITALAVNDPVMKIVDMFTMLTFTILFSIILGHSLARLRGDNHAK